MPTSPNILNYYIGKGAVHFTPTGGTKRHLGNVPTFELTPEIEELEHFSSQSGTRTKDRTVILEKSLAIRIVMDEWSVENLALVLLGQTAVNTSGDTDFSIFTESAITGRIEFTGANDVGNKISVVLPSVSFIPAGTLGFITDEFGQLELTGDVLEETAGAGFGTVQVTEEAS